MTTRRAVTYGGLFCLLAAWLASAASTTRQYQQPTPSEPDRGVVVTSTEALASEVQAHAAKLRERLASAPQPQPHRNPFLFESRRVPAPRATVLRVDPTPIPEPPAAPEPVLFLLGVAEDQGPNGPVRTAILGDDADAMFMVSVGQTVLDRYRVEVIGVDVVQLKDIGNNAIRRLALR